MITMSEKCQKLCDDLEDWVEVDYTESDPKTDSCITASLEFTIDKFDDREDTWEEIPAEEIMEARDIGHFRDVNAPNKGESEFQCLEKLSTNPSGKKRMQYHRLCPQILQQDITKAARCIERGLPGVIKATAKTIGIVLRVFRAVLTLTEVSFRAFIILIKALRILVDTGLEAIEDFSGECCADNFMTLDP